MIVEPADRSAIVAASGPPQFVPAAQLEQSRQQLAALQSHVEQAVDEYKSAYPTQLKFDYAYKANEAPFDIQSIYHDDKFTYIKTNAPEKFSVYEMKDGKPNLVTYDLREGTYIIPEDHGQRICGTRQEEDGIHAQGIAVMTENVFTPHTEPQTEPTLRRNLELPKGVLQKNLKTFVYLGAVLLVIVAALFSSSGKKTPGQQAERERATPATSLAGQHRQ